MRIDYTGRGTQTKVRLHLPRIRVPQKGRFPLPRMACQSKGRPSHGREGTGTSLPCSHNKNKKVSIEFSANFSTNFITFHENGSGRPRSFTAASISFIPKMV